MNHLTQNTLKMAVAAAIAGTSFNAAALIDFVPGGTSSVAVYAKENPGTTTVLGALTTTLSLQIPNLTNAYTVGGSNYYNIKVNLLGGAKFGSSATGMALYCSTAGAATASVQPMGTPSVGGVGFSNATFVVPTAVPLKAKGVCRITGISGVTALKLSGIGTKQVSAYIEYKDGATPASTGYKSNLITFSTALKPAFSVTGNGIIDVAQQTLKYTADANGLPIGGSTALLGRVFFGSLTATNIPADAVGGAGVTGLKATVGNQALSSIKLTLTITGAPLAGATRVTLNSAATCLDADTLFSAVPNGQTVTFASGTVSDYQGEVPAIAATGMYVCMEHDGATAINSGKVTACLSYASETTTVQLQLPKCGQLREMQKNGSTFYGYIIPKSGGRDAVRFRFYNKSTDAGKIRVTMYDETGTMVGTQGAILAEEAAFGPQQVFVADVLAIETAVGGSVTTGRAHAVFEIELPDVQMFATMKNTLDSASPSTNYSTEAVKK